MSRKIWMDRTIEAARTETFTMPWARSIKNKPVPAPAPVKTAACA